ncbi:MAG TPA: glutamate dehydrogenase, partial [Phycisphaerae bacterium]|nr:glutamate dehydrogenase [Phycisphaerae bacterium]
VYAIQTACEHLGVNIEQMRVAVQGFGNVGSVVTSEIARRGAMVVAVADITGGTVNMAGLDVNALTEYVQTSGGVKGFEGGKDIDSQAMLEADCDILIPAATGSVITEANAGQIKARIIAEGANAPTTPQADEILDRKGIFVIPDILCNAGGVFVSYLEYTQETQREQTTLAEVERRLAERIRQTFEEVYHYATRKQDTLRRAAMDLAVSRVVDGVIARGLLP